MKASIFYAWVAGALVAFTVAVHVLGATPRGEALWGVHAYAFLPPLALWLACAVVAAGIAAAGLRGAAPESGAIPVAAADRYPWARVAIAAACALGLFWTFREAHTLLGDGDPLTHNIPLGQRFHHDEPLTLWLHHVWYGLVRPLFDAPGKDPAEIARATVGLSSAIAGALFVPVAWGLARELARVGRTDPDGAGADARAVPLLFVILLAQGYVELFFGYVENYTFYTLALGCYALAALRVLGGRGSLVWAALALVLAITFHLAGAVLVPSFVVLVLHGLASRDRRLATVRDLGWSALIFLGASFVLGRIERGYSLPGTLLGLRATMNPASGYGFRRPSVLDFFNQQALIGPLGLFLFAPAALAALVGGAWRSARSLFLFALGGAYVVASLIAGDSNLGVARNWDLLAPAGFALTLAGVGLAMSETWTKTARRRWLYVMALVSLFHTVPWVALNASFDRSFERFKTLPLGLGRTQATVGAWYLSHGREQEAGRWFRRALDENPHNNFAAFNLGVIAMRHDDYAFARRAFWAALRVRPGVQSYRYALVDALVRSGRPDWARAELDTLLMQNPTEPVYWAASSIVWRGVGRPDSAAAALERAERLAPGDSTLAAVRRHLRQPDGYAIAIERDWPALMVY